jgi:cobalt-zinc-cadmium efflux system protein
MSGGTGRDVEHVHDEHGHDEHGQGEHGHGHGGHSHTVTVGADTDQRYLRMALMLILGYMVIEVVAGIAAHSLALISDAGHMLTDAASLGLALFAMRLSARPATRRLTYGFKRVEILSAQANGITLLVLVGIFGYEAIGRLIHPPQVDGAVVLVVALAGIVINGGAALLISRANRASLNVEGAFQHILNDAWAFAATAVSGLIVMTTGFVRADALASLVVAALMAKAGLTLVRESWKIFLEAAPEGIDTAAVRTALVADAEVDSVHDLHIWTITSGFPALSAHVLVQPGGDCHRVRGRLEEVLHGDYGIRHTTLQVDHVAEPLLVIGRLGSAGRPGPDEHPGHRPDPPDGGCHGR